MTRAFWVTVFFMGCGDSVKGVDTSTSSWATSSSQPTYPSSTSVTSDTGQGTGGTTGTSSTTSVTFGEYAEACEWDPCGGDPVGVWNTVLQCAEGEPYYGYDYTTAYTETTTWSYYAPEYTTPSTWAFGECPNAIIRQEEAFSMSLVIDEDVFNAVYRYTLDAAVTFPAECVADPSCTDATARIALALDELCADGCVEESYSCTPVGETCACEVGATQDTPASVPYTIEGSNLVLDLGSYDVTYEYCVDGDWGWGMMIHQPDDGVTTVLRGPPGQ